MKIVCTMPLDETVRAQLLRAAGSGAEVVDGRNREELIPRAEGAEVIYGGVWPELFSATASRLKWVHVMSAGVEHACFPEMVAHPSVMTNSRGVAAVPIAEHAFALILGFTRRLPVAIRNQDQRKWGHAPLLEIDGQTMGIIGMGNIGREIAKRAVGFGLRVVAVDLQPGEAPDTVAHLWPMERLPELLSQSDIVVNTAPHTAQTSKMLSTAQFARMKPSALFVNVSRGGVVDQDALIAALREGRIAGAALDVVEPEPLPADSPLWEMPNVILTSHSAGGSDKVIERFHALFCENLRRYVAGETLLNLVDKRAGF